MDSKSTTPSSTSTENALIDAQLIQQGAEAVSLFFVHLKIRYFNFFEFLKNERNIGLIY